MACECIVFFLWQFHILSFVLYSYWLTYVILRSGNTYVLHRLIAGSRCCWWKVLALRYMWTGNLRPSHCFNVIIEAIVPSVPSRGQAIHMENALNCQLCKGINIKKRFLLKFHSCCNTGRNIRDLHDLQLVLTYILWSWINTLDKKGCFLA